jgi:hypothetical protein
MAKKYIKAIACYCKLPACEGYLAACVNETKKPNNLDFFPNMTELPLEPTSICSTSFPLQTPLNTILKRFASYCTFHFSLELFAETFVSFLEMDIESRGKT